MSNIPVKNVTPESTSLYEKRKHIYVREITGHFQKLRSWTLWALMFAYFGTAWFNWEGRQAVLFDLPTRQFHIFGVTFWPQDFMLLAWLLIIAAFALFTVTNMAGRLWCGYTCPQSAWSFIFMWIEERTEGTRNARIKLDKEPMSLTKLRKKSLKHTLWLLVAFWTGVTFVGYFTPIRDLVPNMFGLDISGWAAFWIAFFTVATYTNAGWMREQVCIYMCPYARFQSVMYDRDTLAVSYDYNRGEPRGKRSKKEEDASTQKQLGDCVDCSLCVQVCPVGIDIRDGLQYQCIACALCIDACDSIMDKLDKPRGLIRYATEAELEGKKSHFLRPRLVGYAVMVLVMVLAFGYVLLNRMPFKLDVERERGGMYRETVRDTITNGYTLKIINMSQDTKAVNLSFEGPDAIQMNAESQYKLRTNEVREVLLTLEYNPAKEKLKESRNKVYFVITDAETGELLVRTQNTFIAPVR